MNYAAIPIPVVAEELEGYFPASLLGAESAELDSSGEIGVLSGVAVSSAARVAV